MHECLCVCKYTLIFMYILLQIKFVNRVVKCMKLIYFYSHLFILGQQTYLTLLNHSIILYHIEKAYFISLSSIFFQ